MDESPLGKVSVAATTLYTMDFAAALAWYGEALGLEPMMVGSDGHDYATFRIGGSLVVLEPIEACLEPSPPGNENTTVNLVVTRDATDIRNDLIGRGVTCGEIVESPNYRSLLFRDLDGNRYYIAQPVVPLVGK